MTIDDRIQSLAMHLELLTGMHQDFEKRMTQYSADVKDAIARLANIAAAHDQS
jgi:hypothetical protein